MPREGVLVHALARTLAHSSTDHVTLGFTFAALKLNNASKQIAAYVLRGCVAASTATPSRLDAVNVLVRTAKSSVFPANAVAKLHQMMM